MSSIMHSQAVVEVLAKAVEQLQALGIDCLISPLTLPQGASITLHVGTTLEAVVAAEVATTKGAELGRTASTAAAFNNWVAEGLAEAAIERAQGSSRQAN